MPDAIEQIHGATVQHGPLNNRVYLMQLNSAPLHQVVPALDILAAEKGYDKIIAKIPADAWAPFEAAGYAQEVLIPCLFAGRMDALFVAKYFSPQREWIRASESADRFLAAIEPASEKSERIGGSGMLDVVPCVLADTEEMGAIYGRMFQSYPFPIHKPAYLRRMLKEGVQYFGIRMEGRIAAIAAAEIDVDGENVEMTDFATLTAWQGRGLAGMLLRHMELAVHEIGIQTCYTIARAASSGMNAVFKHNGYHYAGFLKNNTQIGGKIESMIVWYKRLRSARR